MIAANRKLISNVRLQLVDHLNRHEHRWSDSADRSAIHGRCYANDRVLSARQSNRLTDDLRIAGICALPVLMREDDNRMCACGDVVLRSDQPTHLSANPEERKV